MFKQIHDFLVRWDLLPILWPVREEGLFGIDDLIGGVVKGVAGWQSGKAKKKAEEDARRLMNEYITGNNEARAKVLEQVGGPEGLMNLARTVQSSSQSTSTTRFDEKSMPEWAKKDNAVVNRLRGLIEGRLAESNAGGVQREQAAKIRDINAKARAAQAARPGYKMGGVGVAGAPGGVGNPEIDAARVSAILGLETPEELARRRSTEDMGQAQSFAEMTKGQHRTGTSTTNQSGTQSSTTHDPFSNINALLTLQSPFAPEVSMQTGMTPGWDAVGSMADSFSALSAANNWFSPKPKPTPQTQWPSHITYGVP